MKARVVGDLDQGGSGGGMISDSMTDILFQITDPEDLLIDWIECKREEKFAT